MKHTLPIFLCLCLIVSAIPAFAVDNKEFDNLNDITQLLSVRCLAQDDDGLIWFGTDKSLYNYDGYDLRSCSAGIGDLQFNSLLPFEGRIYIGCNKGAYIYDPGTESYERIEYFGDEIVRVAVRKGKYIYFGGEAGLFKYNPEEPPAVSSIHKILSHGVFSILADGEMMWVGTDDGLMCMEKEGRGFRSIELGLDDDERKLFTSIYRGEEPCLWVGTVSRLLKLNLQTMQVEPVSSAQVAKFICSDGCGGMYIGTDNGLYRYDAGNRLMTKVEDSVVGNMLEDKDGDIWFASENGIFISHQGKIFKTLPAGDAPDNTLFSCMHRDSKGRLWAGTTHGLMLYEGGVNSPYVLVHRFHMGDDACYLPHNKIKAIEEDRHNGSIYIATDSGCLKYDEESDSFESIETGDANTWVYDILLDGNYIWLATFEGLYCIRDGIVKAQYTISDGLSSQDIAQTVKDHSGNIWILTRDQSVYRLMNSDKSISKYDPGERVSSRFCNRIMSDMEGNIWLSYGNEVVYANHFHGDDFLSVITLEAQKMLDVHSMSDIMGTVWICSSEGIFLLDKESLNISHINSGMKYVSATLDPLSGNILLGALGKAIALDSSDVDGLTGRKECRVKATSVTINGTKQLSPDLFSDGNLTLGSRDNNIVISFSDFNYSREIPTRFHYWIRGRGSYWGGVLPDNKIDLPNLRPGKYTLSISSDSARRNPEGVFMSIHIRKPWYFSIPMLLLYGLIVAGIFFGSVRFVTMRKKLSLEREQRDNLLRQSREKEAFFGNIAHEIKTPLSLIIAPLSKLVQEMEDSGQKEMIQIACDNASKLSALVHQTIDNYREDRGTMDDLIKSEVEFVELADAILQYYKDNYPGLEFIFTSSSPKIMAEVDVVKMETVLNNLLSNACKYTPEGGSVILTLEDDRAEGRLIIKVSDTGVGIPEDEIELVFQRYYESSRTKDAGYDSTGIGLSVIKKHVESHSGSVSVDSDTNGTTFTVLLPCLLKSKGDNTRNISETEGVDESDKPLILIVDDNAQICSFLEKILRHKYRCLSTGNGKSGIKLCRDVIPDLIVSDAMMPVMDGLEMCRQIKEIVPLSTIPIIMLTAKGDSETERKSLEMGIDCFVRKPFDVDTLAARIELMIGDRRRMEQKIRLEMLSAPGKERAESYDERFLRKVTRVIEEHLDDTDFSVQSLRELGEYNEKTLYRKVKQLTGLSTVEYIRSIRLKKAALLLQNGSYTVSEVMYMVGFSNASYFTRSFAAEYGKTPSEYLKLYKNKV